MIGIVESHLPRVSLVMSFLQEEKNIVFKPDSEGDFQDSLETQQKQQRIQCAVQ